MKFFKFVIAPFLSVLFLSYAVIAAQIEGHLHRDSKGLSIHLTTDHKAYKLATFTTDVRDVVARLETYDFIRGQGEIRADQIVLETVDFIGLRSLLGNWSLAGGAYLTFHDFLKASYTVPDFFYPDLVESYTYSLAPGEGQPWRILVSNGTWVSVGYLEILNNKLKIQVVDLKTGHLKKAMELTRTTP